MNSKFFLFAFVILFSASYGVNAYAEVSNYGISYNQVRDAISLYDYIPNSDDHMASATIRFVFEDVDSGNSWEEKTHTSHVSGNSQFSADQSSFVKNTGQFFIHTEYELNGKQLQDSTTLKFIIFDKFSRAALNGCSTDHKLIVKPDYSKAVCVSEKSFEKLSQRGWIGETENKIKTDTQKEKLALVEIDILRLENNYKPDDQIVIAGYVWGINGHDISNDDIPVIIQIQNPTDDLVEIAQVKVSDEGKYSHLVNVVGSNWQQNGLYTVTISYGTDVPEQTSFAFSTNSDKFSIQNALNSESYAYEDLCGFPVTDEMHMNAIYDNSYRFTPEGIPYFELNPATFSHVEIAPHYPSHDPHLNYWFDLDNKPRQIAFRIGACDVDGSGIARYEKRN